MDISVLASVTASSSSSGFSIAKVLIGGACFLIFVIGGMWLTIRQQKQRQSWAESHGFRYVEADPNLGNATRFVFGLAGRKHVARDIVVIPTAAGSALYYEVTWVERHGEDEEEKRCTFLRYSLPGPMPRMHIKPEGLFGFANNDINTEWQAFNKEFDVKSEDEQAAHALLTGPMQEFLMARMRKMHMEFLGAEAFLRLSNYKSEDSIAYANLMNEWLSKVPGFFFGRR